MKYKHQRRWRAAYLALAAAGALLSGTAAQAAFPAPTPQEPDATPVTLTCSAGVPSVTATFTTDTGAWSMKGDTDGFGGGVWFKPYGPDTDSPQPSAWTNPPTFGGSWLMPGQTNWGPPYVSTANPYLAARAVKLEGPVDTGNVKVHIRYFVDDYLNGVAVTQDKTVTHSAVTGTLSGGVVGTYSALGEGDFNTGSWKAGMNYLLLKIINNGPRLHTKGPAGSGGAHGLAAEVTITAGCKALPGAGAAPVPVNSPWALGLLGVAVAGAAARTRRRKR